MRRIELMDGTPEYIGSVSFKDSADETSDEMKDFIYLVKEKMGNDSAQFLKDYADDWENPSDCEDWEGIADGYSNCLTDVYNDLESVIQHLQGKQSLTGKPFRTLVEDLKYILNNINQVI